MKHSRQSTALRHGNLKSAFPIHLQTWVAFVCSAIAASPALSLIWCKIKQLQRCKHTKRRVQVATLSSVIVRCVRFLVNERWFLCVRAFLHSSYCIGKRHILHENIMIGATSLGSVWIGVVGRQLCHGWVDRVDLLLLLYGNRCNRSIDTWEVKLRSKSHTILEACNLYERLNEIAWV